MSNEPRDVVGAVLPKSWSQSKKDELADEILEALDEAGLLAADEIEAVGIRGARIPVETVEAYGLVIGVDANGDAAEIGGAHWPLEVLA
jgi:hypothetical protein